MKHKNFVIIKAALLSLAFILLLIYIIPLGASSEFDMTKTLFLYTIFIMTALFWTIAIAYKAYAATASEIIQKYDNIERLLLDLRDGTKYFFKEKRRSFRIKTDLLARFADKSTGDDFVKISDISHEGAQLRTVRVLKAGETLRLNIYLPFFSQPINAKVRVMRARHTAELKGTSAIFDTGVEYIELSDQDREKLVETINILSRMPRKNRNI
jgi:hypothetical protein